MRPSRTLGNKIEQVARKTKRRGYRVFFTADEHYGHKNILDYSDRPFGSVEEMDAALIKRHNSVVQRGDLVIHIGDFSLVPSAKLVQQRYVRKLKGDHIFLVGDHDKWLNKEIHRRFYTLQTPDFLYVCLHWPLRSWPAMRFGSYHLHGHSHGRLPVSGRSIDVGVDNWNYYPVPAQDVRKRIRKESKSGYVFPMNNMNARILDSHALVDRDV